MLQYEWVDLLNLVVEAFKAVIGGLILAAMIHIDQAGVHRILVDLVLLSELEKAPEHEQLVVIIEILLSEEHDQLIKVDHVLNFNSLSEYHQKVKIDK